jgi:hypothetical protein
VDCRYECIAVDSENAQFSVNQSFISDEIEKNIVRYCGEIILVLDMAGY